MTSIGVAIGTVTDNCGGAMGGHSFRATCACVAALVSPSMVASGIAVPYLLIFCAEFNSPNAETKRVFNASICSIVRSRMSSASSSFTEGMPLMTM